MTAFLQRFLVGSSLMLAIVLLFGVNMLSNLSLKSWRLDLTENRLYTLTQGTRNVLANLQEPLQLRFYFSQRLAADYPGIAIYAQQVRELLEEYHRLAQGKINLEIIDPESFSADEDRAVSLGLQGVPLENGAATFYFGLAGSNSTDGEAVIAFFQPDREAFLEYDLTKLVYQLTQAKPKAIGVISTLPWQGGFGPLGSNQPWVIYEQLQQSFELRPLALTTRAIPDDLELLLLVHPKGLEEGLLYAIDQFVLRGGRVLALLDPHAESDLQALGETSDYQGFKQLLTAWGVELVPGKAVADLSRSLKVRINQEGRSAVASYPVWMNLTPDQFARQDLIVANLTEVVLATPGALRATAGATTQLTPLLQSTTNAMLVDTAILTDTNTAAVQLLQAYRPDGERYTLAARLTGKPQSAFKAAPAAPEGTPPAVAAAHIQAATTDINLVLIADTDWLQDRFWVQVQDFLGQRVAVPDAANGSLLVNAVDTLSGSSDLISVRSRASASRPFTRIQALQQEAERQFRAKEQELQTRLKETEQKLLELQARKTNAQSLVLSPEQQQEVILFREEKVKIRKELRTVQHELQKNITELENSLKFLNVALMPILVIGVGLVLHLFRRRPRRRAVDAFHSEVGA